MTDRSESAEEYRRTMKIVNERIDAGELEEVLARDGAAWGPTPMHLRVPGTEVTLRNRSATELRYGRRYLCKRCQKLAAK